MTTKKLTPDSFSLSISNWISGAALVTGFALLISGCAGSKTIPTPTAKHVEYAGHNGYPASLPALKLGRKLYISRCSACHNLKEPASVSPADWPAEAGSMGEKANMNTDQIRAITQYLVAISAAARDTSTAAPAAMGSKSGS